MYMKVNTVVLLLATFAFAAPLRADELVFGGGGAGSGGQWISTPNARFRNDGPGIVFGMYRTPGSSDAPGYIVLYRGIDGRSIGIRGRATSDGNTTTSMLGLEVGGRKQELVHKVEYNPTSKLAVTESLTLDGKPLDLTKGRVLLVAVDKAWAVQQYDVDLRRAPAGSPKTLEEVEAQAKGLLKWLSDGSELVRSFLK